MKNILRKVVMASLAVAAIVVGTVSASAESSVKVPFAFKVGNKVCPAGEYIVQDGHSHNLLTLKSRDAKVNFSWVLMPGDGINMDSNKTTLRFDVIGDTQLLNSIRYGTQKTPTIDKGTKSLERSMTIIQGQ
jgi:hypothetical protein